VGGAPERLTAQEVLGAYAMGIFPMSDSRDDPELFFVDPARRGVLPLDELHLPRRLGRTVRSDRFHVTADTAFEAVLDACAEPGEGERADTWINPEIRRLYLELHAGGHAHSIEAWADDRLVGGLYGVALGAAFFGESMFSRQRDASKVALAHLVARLRRGGFRLLDVQFLTDHLATLGVVEIDRADYRARLGDAIARDADFYAAGALVGIDAWQEITQAS
jgi:leucyl/phenylalanyl-tRNA---protein transferase